MPRRSKETAPDDDGNVTQITDSLGDTVTSLYDGGNLVQRGYSGPNGQLLLTMSYDDNDNLIGVNRYSDLAGTQLVSSSSYVYDALGDVTNIVHSNAASATLASFSYSYDTAGQLTQEVDNGTTTSYSYDAAGQLISAGTSNYSYDANGNPTQGGTNVVGLNNELTADGTWSYTYDADGNLIGKVGVSGGADAGLTWTYSYDPGNEMTGATETNGSQTLVQDTFTYDVFGHLISMSISTNGDAAVATNFVYNGDELWAQLTGPSQSPTVYISGDQADQYFAQVDASNGVSWLLTDHLGSVRVVTNAAGQATGTNNYDAYGNVISMATPTQDATIGYAGSLYEITTGLNREDHRWYNAQTGQWTTVDPLGLQPGPNPYEYVNDAPTNATDPTGMAAQPRSLTQDATIQRILGEEQQQRLGTLLQSLSPAEQQKVAQWWSKLSEAVRQKYAVRFQLSLSNPGRSNAALAENLKNLPESDPFTKVANLEAARKRQAEQAEFDALTRRPLTSQEEFARMIMPSVNRATAARAADALTGRYYVEDQRRAYQEKIQTRQEMTLTMLNGALWGAELGEVLAVLDAAAASAPQTTEEIVRGSLNKPNVTGPKSFAEEAQLILKARQAGRSGPPILNLNPTPPNPVRNMFNRALAYVQERMPASWRKVPAAAEAGPVQKASGWRWIDENGVERYRYMYPDKNGKFLHEQKGYWRVKNELGQFLDENGNVVLETDPLFHQKTHIIGAQ